jgi:hypothetical protein
MVQKNIILGLMLLIQITVIQAANVAWIAQTGQTQSYDPAGRDLPTAGKPWPSVRFIIDSSGECVIDKLTGLMWLRDPNTVNSGKEVTLAAAKKVVTAGRWCGGYQDWRVPSLREGLSLTNYGEPNNLEWLNRQGFHITQPTYLLSGYRGSSGKTLYLQEGLIQYLGGGSSYLFPVRGGR